MEKIAVFVNDAAYARHLLQPMLEAGLATHWVMVACPPTLTRHIGRWVSQSARTQWRERWANELLAELEPDLKARPGNQVEKLIASKPLPAIAARLQSRLGGLRLLDARRPRLGKADEPITLAQPSAEGGRWVYPVAVTTGLSAVLALAD
jgi:hypothetical protein